MSPDPWLAEAARLLDEASAATLAARGEHDLATGANLRGVLGRHWCLSIGRRGQFVVTFWP